MVNGLIAAAALLAGGMATAREPAVPAGLHVERVAVTMRHGVRPPTKAPALPPGSAADPWPAWPVPPGWLTPHGRKGVTNIARYDRAAWRGLGVLPAHGCARVRVVADSDERTIATAQAYVAALASGCHADVEHRPQDEPDPLFSAIATGAAPGYDPAKARAAVLAAAGPGGIAGVERRMRPLLARLDAILCGRAKRPCGIGALPSGLEPPRGTSKPKLTGALDRASSAAQTLLLEYAQGKPMADVGWGRATPADIARLSAFHATEFRLLARPRYVARAHMAGLAPILVAALTERDAPAVTMISGHDTDIAALGGLLGVHWQVPGLAADDPAPASALVLERLVDRTGRAYVRALYRSQTPAQIRRLADPAKVRPYVRVLPIPGCDARGVRGLCDEGAIRRLLG